MIDLNPYFKKKLGETLVFKPDPKGTKYHMEVIATSEMPNTVSLEVISLEHQDADLDYAWKYHGVVEVDLNGLKSVMTVKKAVVVGLENPSKAINAKKII